MLQRIAVVAAGPLANFLLAIVAFWALFLAGESGYAPVIGEVESGSVAEIAGLEPGQEIVAVDGEETPTWQALSFRLLDRIGDSGTISFAVKYPDSDVVYESEAVVDRWLAGQEDPDLYSGLGIRLYTPDVVPLVGELVEGGPAERAGIRKGDQVLSADGVDMPLWVDWVNYVRARPGETIAVTLERDGSTVELDLVPERVVEEGETGDLVVFTLNSIKKMIQGLISPKNLSGPITIAKVASASAKSGLESYISFLALLSISLGVLNLLPIPVLDGGHLLYYTVELLAGRPVPEKIQALGYQLGLFLVLGIMMLALYNDFARL